MLSVRQHTLGGGERIGGVEGEDEDGDDEAEPERVVVDGPASRRWTGAFFIPEPFSALAPSERETERGKFSHPSSYIAENPQLEKTNPRNHTITTSTERKTNLR